ncbi:MAG: glycosyltransferase family 39 protein, partial [Gammaproteobacteria bacterium]
GGLINPARIKAYAMFAAFAAFAYLACVNLDWALFWDDEALIAFLARNWLEFGAPLVDDGRNVYAFHRQKGADIAADGTAHYPPLMPGLQALAFALFGAGEAQARMVSALLSLAGMALFADILRREFPRRHGLIAVAFALACLSPMTLGYARTATYNSAVLFFHMAAFWSYLRFCERNHAGYAALMCAAAIGGFHAHYLSGLVFACAFGAMHLLFRARAFDRRHLCIISLAGAAYAAQVLWHYFFVYDVAGYAHRPVSWSAGNLARTLGGNLAMLNRNGVLAWSVAVSAAGWCVARALWRWRRHLAPGGEALRELRDDRVLQYMAMIFAGVCALSLIGLNTGIGEVRYFSSFAPFAAVPAAAVVCRAWRAFRPAGAALCALLLLTNAAGWPFLNSYQHAGKPGWTLPLLAAGYHHQYRDALREALDYLRENAAQDDVVYVNHPIPVALFWYAADLRLCCRFAGRAQLPPAIDARAREYLFEDKVRRGMPDPHWLLFTTRSRAQNVVFRNGGPRYRRIGGIPDRWHWAAQRPEPLWHISFPERSARFAAAAPPPHHLRLYRIARDE